MSRDPIGERGGVNLYGFLKNDGVVGVDLLGCNLLGDLLDQASWEFDNIFLQTLWNLTDEDTYDFLTGQSDGPKGDLQNPLTPETVVLRNVGTKGLVTGPSYLSYEGRYITGWRDGESTTFLLPSFSGCPKCCDEWKLTTTYYSWVDSWSWVHDLRIYQFDVRYRANADQARLADLAFANTIIDVTTSVATDPWTDASDASLLVAALEQGSYPGTIEFENFRHVQTKMIRENRELVVKTGESPGLPRIKRTKKCVPCSKSE